MVNRRAYEKELRTLGVFNLKHQKKPFLLAVVMLALCFQCFSQQKDKLLPDRDKADIVKSVLEDSDLENRTLSIGEEKDVVPLSVENISPSHVPKLQGLSFDLLTTQEIKEKTQNGFTYFWFGKFIVKGTRVQVEFGDTSLYARGEEAHSNSVKYEFRKVKGKWKAKRIGFSISQS
jgi:hypothetical protein